MFDPLVEYLRQTVPLTRQIDIRAGQRSAEGLELLAPLEPNLNDKQTAFGGTLATLCTLAGWCVVSDICKSAELSIDIAVTESNIRYRLPVRSNPIAALGLFPEPAGIDQFLNTLQEKGLANLEINVIIESEDKAAVNFNGRYHARLL